MARPLRIEYPDAWYHVMNRARKSEILFSDKEDYYLFLKLLKEITEVWNARLAAFCMMTNHYHLLMQTPDANLSRCMRHIDGLYTQYYNRKYKSDGPLFKGRYKSILVDKDSYLLELVRYIHRNPLEAGLAQDLNSYNWSSHKCYLSNAKSWEWIYKQFILDMFSQDKVEAKNKYLEFVLNELPEGINQIFGGKKLPSIIGSDTFIDQIKKTFYDKKIDTEIPESKLLSPEVDRIKAAVCEEYRLQIAELDHFKRGSSNEARDMAVYLCRRLRGSKLTEIGKEFGISSYSTVSTIIGRMKRRISQEQRVKKRAENLMDGLKMSQRQT